MMSILKSTFMWQFTGGFLVGAVALFALTPAQSDPFASAPTHIAR